MTDRRSPSDFYHPVDVDALPRSTARAPTPPSPAPSFWNASKAAFRLNWDELSLTQESRLDNAYRPLADDMIRRGVPRNRLYRPGAGGGRAGPTTDTLDRDAVWAQIERERPLYPGVPANREAFEQAPLTRYGGRAVDQDVASRGGVLPQLYGGLSASFGDPLNDVAMLTGAGEVSLARRIAIDALTNMGLTAVETPVTIRNRRRMGEQTSARDVAADIGLAGAFGAAFPIGIEGVGIAARGVRSGAGRLADALRTHIGEENLTPAERDAAAALDREDETLATSPFEPGAGSDEHLARMQAAEAQLLAPTSAEAVVNRNLYGPSGVKPPRPRGAPDPFANTRTAVAPPAASAASSAGAWQSVKDRIRHVESGGNANARNPLSSAAGLYQVIDDTWLRNIQGMAGTAGKSRGELLALKSNPAYQEAVMDRLGASYRARLAAIGAPETPGNLYLLHFAGEGGGASVLRAAADTPIEQVLGADAIAANSWLRGKTAGELRAWADRKMGGGGDAGLALRRDVFPEGEAGAAEHEAAQAQVAAEEAARASERARVSLDDDDPVPGFDDAAPITRGDPFAHLDETPAMPRRGEDDVRGFWAEQQAAGKRRSAVWVLRDDDGRMVDWGHTEQDALDRADARGMAGAQAERVAPGELADVTKETGAELGDTWGAPPSSTWFTVSDSIGPDGPMPERVRVIRRSNGDAAIIRDDGQVLDIGSQLRAGQSVEEAIAGLLGHDTTGRNVSPDVVDQVEGVEVEPGRLAPSKEKIERAPEQSPDAPHTGPRDDVGAPPAPVEGFDHPDDVAATAQIEALEPELRAWAESPEAGSVRLDEEGGAISAADALAEVDADEAAIDAAERAWRDGDHADEDIDWGDGEEEDGLHLQTKAEATEAVNALREAAADRALDRVVAEEQGATDTPAQRSALTSLRDALIRLDAGHIDADHFRRRVQGILSAAYEDRFVKRYRGTPDRQRGALWIREKLLGAVRNGDLDQETAEFAEWFVRRNPTLVDELAISVRGARGGAEQGARGTYNPAARLITLFRGADVSTTVVHEILHHTERLMPARFQQAIQGEWARRVARLAARGSEQEQRFARAVLELQLAPTAANMDRAIGAMPEGAYQLLNPSEFWAVNGADLLQRRFKAGGVWRRIGTWMREMVQHVRGRLGLASNAPVLRAIDDLVANGEGAAQSPMLSRAARYHQTGTGFAGAIDRAVKAGEIDGARAARMKATFAELLSYYKRSMGPDAAASTAGDAALKQLKAEARLKKRQTLLQINRQREAVKELDRFSGSDRYSAIEALLDDDDRAAYRDGNVSSNIQKIEFDAHRQMHEFIASHRRNLLGRPHDDDELENVGRELFGQATGDERAKVFAESINATREGLRQRSNAAGSNIGKIDNYGLRQSWSAMSVRMAGDTAAAQRTAFVEAAMPELDRARMIDDRTGVPFTDDAMRKALDDVAETIRTNGLTGEASGAFRGVGKLANQGAEHRFLHFKDFDAWKRVNDRFGSDDNIFSIVMGQVNGLAKNIAMMERLGPNPDATIRYLVDHVNKTEAKSDKGLVAAVAGKPLGQLRVETLWRYMNGDSTAMVIGTGPKARLRMAAVRGIQGWRNLNVARKFGSAVVSAVPGDLATTGNALHAYGLSAIGEHNNGLMAQGFRMLPEARALAIYMNEMKGDKVAAARLNLGMQDAAHSMSSLARYMGEASGPGWTQVAADSVLRVTGLNVHTTNIQNAVGREVLRVLGDSRAVAWEALPTDLRGGLERSGIGKYDWTGIRNSPVNEALGPSYIDPSAIGDQRLRDRLMGYVLRVRAAAVQESSVRQRAYATLGTHPGTIGGELIRNTILGRSFSMALLLKQGTLMASLGPRRGALLAARFLIFMTLSGAVTMQAREVLKGNDPLPMDDRHFWMRAFTQGGGIGVLGDLFGAVTDARLGSFGSFVAGPLGGDIDTGMTAYGMATPGELRQDGTRKAANPLGAALLVADRLSPASSVWYLRAAWERIVIDQLRADADPNASITLANHARARRKARQGQWWAEGDMAPHRAPNMENALGEEPLP